MRQKSRISSSIRKASAGAVVFYIENKTIYILLLVQNRPDMLAEPGPKGEIERGETAIVTAHREIREELGIFLHLDTGFKCEIAYKFKNTYSKTRRNALVSKTVTYFLAFMHPREKRRISVSSEHLKYYFLPIDKAIEEARFETQKEVLRAAKEYIAHKYLT